MNNTEVWIVSSVENRGVDGIWGDIYSVHATQESAEHAAIAAEKKSKNIHYYYKKYEVKPWN